MGLTMEERKAVTREVRRRYERGRKKEKGRMLDEFCEVTGYGRCYAARVLRGRSGRKAEKRKDKPKGRTRKYGEELLEPLKRLWAVADGICGKRLAAILPEMIGALERFGEMRLDARLKAMLLEMSAATIDRLLAPERKKMQLKGRSGTKPGSLLKSQIPIRTFSDWNENVPGFLEVDLVAHDGGDARGEFIQTLDMVDIYSGWTETRAVKNKAQIWVFEALQEVRGDLPFPLLGLDSDNGAEFINDHLVRYCQENSINFTRSRPYRKNDSCHVEQKNWTVVRRAVGYQRYETDGHLQTLNRLYRLLGLYTNFFQPSMKLTEKTRQGSKVTKRYDKPRTPYRRLLSSPHLSPKAKQRLNNLYQTLNPAQLQRNISSLQSAIGGLATPTKHTNSKTKKEVIVPSQFEYILT